MPREAGEGDAVTPEDAALPVEASGTVRPPTVYIALELTSEPIGAGRERRLTASLLATPANAVLWSGAAEPERAPSTGEPSAVYVALETVLDPIITTRGRRGTASEDTTVTFAVADSSAEALFSAARAVSSPTVDIALGTILSTIITAGGGDTERALAGTAFAIRAVPTLGTNEAGGAIPSTVDVCLLPIASKIIAAWRR